VASLTLLTTLLDFADSGEIGCLVDEAAVQAREATIGKGGLLKGSELASVFSSLRANDLIWQYVVGNYLKGKTPPAFDLLFWNADATNLPGPFLAWYLRNMYLENNLRVPGKLEMCGVKADLGRVDMPAFIYASREDHIVPWKSAYQSRRPARRRDHLRAGRLGPYCRRHQPGGQEQAQPLDQRQRNRECRRVVRHRDRGQGQLVAGVGQLAQGAGRRRASCARQAGQQSLPAGRAGAGQLRQGKSMKYAGVGHGATMTAGQCRPRPNNNREEK
jgi:hypothetical protein